MQAAEEVYEDRRAETVVAALSRLTISGRRHRTKPRGRFSIRNDTYRVAPSLRDDVHELGQIPFRADVGERTQKVAVLILRLRGGPAAMIRWRQWPMPIAFVGKMLGMTEAMARTAMRYLEGELIERAPCELDPHGKPIRAKQTVDRGGKRVTIDKPTLWQFTDKFAEKLRRLHGFKFRRRKSQLGMSIPQSYWGKYKDEIGLAKRFFMKYNISNLPRCDLQTVPRQRIEPPSKPAMHCSVPSPHSRPMDEHITLALTDEPEKSTVPPGQRKGPLFPNYVPPPRCFDPRERATQEAAEIARARRTPVKSDPDKLHTKRMKARCRVA